MTSLRLVTAAAAILVILGAGTGAQAASMFVDPSHYDLYNCDQLNKARAQTAARVAELQGLMAKAETGFAGALMSGLAYQSDYLATRGQLDLIDQKRAEFRCGPLPENATPPKPATTDAQPKRKRH
jgi:hypothetical protein